MSTAAHLKELRLAASPPVSIRKMADLLGLDHSTYVRYERPDRFKKKHLPLDFAKRVAAVLADHGVPANDVLALAGVTADDVTLSDLTAGEERWVEIWRAMSAEQRSLMVSLAEQIIGRKPADRVHQAQEYYRAPDLSGASPDE